MWNFHSHVLLTIFLSLNVVHRNQVSAPHAHLHETLIFPLIQWNLICIAIVLLWSNTIDQKLILCWIFYYESLYYGMYTRSCSKYMHYPYFNCERNHDDPAILPHTIITLNTTLLGRFYIRKILIEARI